MNRNYIEFNRRGRPVGSKDKQPRKKRLGTHLKRAGAALATGAAVGAAAVPALRRRNALNTIKTARKVHSAGTRNVNLGKRVSRSYAKGAASRDLGPGRDAMENVAAKGANLSKQGRDQQQTARAAIRELRKQNPIKPRRK